MNVLRVFAVVWMCTQINGTSLAQLNAEQEQAIDQIFTKCNRTDRPGCALAIVQEGQIIYKKGYGMADLERGVPITPSTVFYAGSISKQFVAACVLLLVEEGQIALDEPVQRYLPDFPRYQATITVRHLVHHTSGIRDYFGLLEEAGLNYLNQIPTAQVYDLIKATDSLDFDPGSDYRYSNSGYLMLAMIVEKVSGQRFADFAREQIFEPLGMKHSRFLDDASLLVPNRAWGYRETYDGEIKNMIMRFDLVGSGGLYTTVEDLYLWDQNFYRPRIGSPAFLETMLTSGKLNDGSDTRYAFAIRKDRFKGLPLIGHSGSLGGYRAQYLQFPEQAFSIIILGNSANFKPGERAHEVANLLLAEHFD